MLKLKSGLRFNAQMRDELATIVATATTGTMSDDLQDEKYAMVSEILEAYWASSELHQNFKTFVPENYMNGEFPLVGILQVTSDGVRHTLAIDPAPIPFSVYMDQFEAYDNLVSDELKANVSSFISENSEHQIEFNKIKVKIEAFISTFTSPARLLLAAPDFAEHFPEYYFAEETDSEVLTSIANLIAA